MSTVYRVPTGAEPSESHQDTRSKPTSGKTRNQAAWRLLRPLASLQLTVGLFSLSMVLVFFATMAQIDQSNIAAQTQYVRSWYVWIPFQLIAQFLQKFFHLPETVVWSGSFPFIGGRILGAAMLLNLIAAHLTRFKFSVRRIGVIILHLGVIILLGGELITQMYAVEARMMMQVGESKNFLDRAREVELAFTDDADRQSITIPDDMLIPGKTISQPELPVDVEIVKRFKNSTLRGVTGGDDSSALVSIFGHRYQIVESNESSGVKSEQPEDVPAIHVRLLKKGTAEVLAEHTYSLWEYENGPSSRQFMALPSQVTVDGHTYTVGLRNERIYKPYTITLLNFEHKKYAGTEMAKDFASTVRLQDSETGEDRTVRIWMNHPLRHRGETFYQLSTVASETAGGDQTGKGPVIKDTGTVLQVVNNPGWRLPYVSCFVVSLGMLIHFGMTLVRFLDKKLRAWHTPDEDRHIPGPRVVSEEYSPAESLSNRFIRALPGMAIALCAIYAVETFLPKHETYEGFDLTEFGAIPVLDDGRIKPLDTLARTKMLYISGQSEFEETHIEQRSGTKRPAILWLLELLASTDSRAGKAGDFPIFRIDNEQLLQLLGLEFRPGFYRYSYNEITDNKNFDQFLMVYKTAQGLDENKRELLHGKVLELAGRMTQYRQIAFHAAPTLIPKEPGSDKWLSLAEIDEKVSDSPQFAQEAKKKATREVEELIKKKFPNLEKLPEDELRSIQQAAISEIDRLTDKNLREIAARERETFSPAAGAFNEILAAYRGNRQKGFGEAIGTYTSQYVYPLSPEFTDTVRIEQWLNQSYPLISAAFLFLFAAVFRIVGWMVWEKPMSQTAWGLAFIGLALMAATLLGRMYIMQRPLVIVTNLYSSAVAIGAGAMAVCLMIERIFKNGLGLIVGAGIAASAVFIAGHLSEDGKDTMGALVAVLDTNYWLASHVTCVTMGYAATLVAGFLGLGYLIWGLFFATLTKEKNTQLGSMIYGVLCFATLLSFVGTVLGGIWADQSWGRFWGWDPKENGAVLIVIWNAMILHARWCGLVKQRGMAVLSVVGIMVTTWSWFGTNQLGAGLHNYGFNQSLAEGCAMTWVFCSFVIAAGLIPLKYWRSFWGTGQPRPEVVLATTSLPERASAKDSMRGKNAKR